MGATARMAFGVKRLFPRRRLLVVRIRQGLRESEAALILLAAIVGLAAGVLTNVQSLLAHGLQQLLYGVTANRLSALGSIHHPWRLVATGQVLGVVTEKYVRRRYLGESEAELRRLFGE